MKNKLSGEPDIFNQRIINQSLELLHVFHTLYNRMSSSTDILKSDTKFNGSDFNDYVKKPFIVKEIPEFVWESLCARQNKFWIKCQNGRIMKGYLRWLSGIESCPSGSNCEIFCRAAVDKYTSYASSNRDYDDGHLLKYHWNEIQQFPIIISKRQRSYKIDDKTPLQHFTESIVCPKIFLTKGERIRMASKQGEQLKIDESLDDSVLTTNSIDVPKLNEFDSICDLIHGVQDHYNYIQQCH